MNISAERLKKIKAIAIDLDGTALLPDTTLGEHTIKVLKELIKRNFQIIICTGRAIIASERYRTAIGAEGAMVYHNGAEVVDMPSGTILTTVLLKNTVVDFCVDIARSMGLHYQVYLSPSGPGNPEILATEKYTDEAEMYRLHTGLVPLIQDIKTIISAPEPRSCIKGMFLCEPSFHDEIRQNLIKQFGDTIYITRTYPTFLEVMTAGVSKGEGLKIAMKYRGLNAESVLAAGDEENDLLMLKAAGLSAAPSNARENVKAAADFIFRSNAEEGLALFLEEQLL